MLLLIQGPGIQSVLPILSNAAVALTSLLLGVALNEYLRRRHRIESYSQPIFQKRIEIYEKLYKELTDAGEVASYIAEDDELTGEQRHELASKAILDLAEFCDENSFYFDEEVTLNSVGIFIGVEDIPLQKSKKKKEQALKDFKLKLKRAKDIIRAEAGLTELDRLFASIVKPDHSSALVDYYRSLKAERAAKSRAAGR